MARTPIIAGNWKMNKGTAQEAAALVKDIQAQISNASLKAEIVICPPYTVLAAAREAIGSSAQIALGAQDLFWKGSGAYTSQISAPMLVDAGVKYVIIGHSETRGRFGVAEPDFTSEVLKHFGESDVTVNRKAKAALEAGLIPIVCIGETLAERQAGQTDDVIRTQVRGALDGIAAAQVAGMVFAYEPVWAIGTGEVCGSDEADRVCGVVRSTVSDLYDAPTAEAVRIQYGGSMKPDNAVELLGKTNIDGGLIGGAALKGGDFIAIVRAAG